MIGETTLTRSICINILLIFVNIILSFHLRFKDIFNVIIFGNCHGIVMTRHDIITPYGIGLIGESLKKGSTYSINRNGCAKEQIFSIGTRS